MISRHALPVAALGVFAGFAALPTARAAEPAPPIKPAISEEARTAVSRMGESLMAKPWQAALPNGADVEPKESLKRAIGIDPIDVSGKLIIS